MYLYTAITGLIVDQLYKVEIPPHRARWLPNGETKDFGKMNVDFLFLSLNEFSNELNIHLDDSDLINKIIEAISPIASVDVNYAFLKIETEIIEPELDLVSVFVIDAIRFYTGANIEIGPQITIYPSEIENKKRTLFRATKRLSALQGYVLNKNIIDGFRNFLATFGDVYSVLNKVEDIKIAFRYLEWTFGFLSDVRFEDKILFTTIAFEALFSPSANQELKYRVCQNASVFLGADDIDRGKIFHTISLAYDIRSAVAHGSFAGFHKFESKFKKIGFGNLYEFCDYLNHCARESIMRRAILYFKDSSCNKDIVVEILEEYCRHIHSRVDILKLETITQPISTVKR